MPLIVQQMEAWILASYYPDFKAAVVSSLNLALVSATREYDYMHVVLRCLVAQPAHAAAPTEPSGGPEGT